MTDFSSGLLTSISANGSGASEVGKANTAGQLSAATAGERGWERKRDGGREPADERGRGNLGWARGGPAAAVRNETVR